MSEEKTFTFTPTTFDQVTNLELFASKNLPPHKYCDDKSSFLGVANTACLHEHISTAVLLLGIIVIVSICVEKFIHLIRECIKCPQLRKITDRMFEELMIMGFISMVIFILNTSSTFSALNIQVSGLSALGQLHFYEFFHYLVFLTMIYFILIVLWLLLLGTVVPNFVWKLADERDVDGSSEDSASFESEEEYGDLDDWRQHPFDPNMRNTEVRLRIDNSTATPNNYSQCIEGTRPSKYQRREITPSSGMDLVDGSRAYGLLLQRYQSEGFCFYFNIKKQWHLWKNFEFLAYKICQHRSGYLYKNPAEMERIFGVKQAIFYEGQFKLNVLTYGKYHKLCMRNLMLNISHLKVHSLLVLVMTCVVPIIYPKYDHWIFIGVGLALLLTSLVIFFKVMKILRGIVDDRLHIISARDIQARFKNFPHKDSVDSSDCEAHVMSAQERDEWRKCHKKKRITFRAVAMAVRATIRMQMSALCHRQLHYHDERFWFQSPMFLLQCFHVATVGQAFYLVWFSLVEAPKLLSASVTANHIYLILVMVLFPFIVLCIITPLTMPSLVLVMSLTGIFVDLNGDTVGDTEKQEIKNNWCGSISRFCFGSSVRGRNKKKKIQKHQRSKTRIRHMRRMFLQSQYSTSYTDYDNQYNTPLSSRNLGSNISYDRYQSSPTSESQSDGMMAPSPVFLRMYDRPGYSSNTVGNTNINTRATPEYNIVNNQRQAYSTQLIGVHEETSLPANIHDRRSINDSTTTSHTSSVYAGHCTKYGGYHN